jgi:hypothetical protein
MSTVTCPRCGKQTGAVARRTGYCPDCVNETHETTAPRPEQGAGQRPEYVPASTEPCGRCGGTGQEQFAAPGWTRGEVPGRMLCVLLGLSSFAGFWVFVGFLIGHLSR